MSTGTLEMPYHDRYHPPSRLTQGVRTSPRSSADRLPDYQLPPPRAYQGDRAPSTRYPVAYPRPRRATMESDQQQRPALMAGARPAVHPPGTLVRTGDPDPDEDYYVYPSATAGRPRRSNVGVDEADRGRLGGYAQRPDRNRVPEAGGYPRYQRRNVYRYDGAPGTAPVEERSRNDGRVGEHRERRRSSIAARDGPYPYPVPGRRRADSVDAGRRLPLDMTELKQSLPRVPEPRPRAEREREPDRLLGLPAAGYAAPAGLYQQGPVDPRMGGDDPLGGGRRQVLLHQDDGPARSRHPDPAYSYEYGDDRGHRAREHVVDDRDRRPPVVSTGHPQSPRLYDRSPGHAPDERLMDDRDDHARSPRHRRDDRRYHGHRREPHHRSDDEDDDADRRLRRGPPSRGDYDASRQRFAPQYDPPDRHRLEHDHDAPPRSSHAPPPHPPPPTLPYPASSPENPRQPAHHDRDYRPREEDVRGRRDSLPPESRGLQVADRGYDPRDHIRDRQRDLDGPAMDVARLDPSQGVHDDDDDEHHRGRISHRPDHGAEMAASAMADQQRGQVRLVSPPQTKDARPLKGILREPKEKFPEDPAPVREGVAPLKEALKDGRKGIPSDARWTKIDRRRVNPAALDEAKERYEERSDHVIVLRVLPREEIEALAARTEEIRGTFPSRGPSCTSPAIGMKGVREADKIEV